MIENSLNDIKAKLTSTVVAHLPLNSLLVLLNYRKGNLIKTFDYGFIIHILRTALFSSFIHLCEIKTVRCVILRRMLFLYCTYVHHSAVYWSRTLFHLYISIHPHKRVCIMALQIVILWFLCFYTIHVQCQICWWIMQRKENLKETDANYYLLPFTLNIYFKGLAWGASQVKTTKY